MTSKSHLPLLLLGLWSLVFGRWSLVVGLWSLAIGCGRDVSRPYIWINYS